MKVIAYTCQTVHVPASVKPASQVAANHENAAAYFLFDPSTKPAQDS